MDHCASSFIEICAKKQFQEMFHEMMQGVKGVFGIICVPGKDQDGTMLLKLGELLCNSKHLSFSEYLQYSECYQLVTVKECNAITNKFRKNVKAHNLNGNTTDQKDFCW